MAGRHPLPPCASHTHTRRRPLCCAGARLTMEDSKIVGIVKASTRASPPPDATRFCSRRRRFLLSAARRDSLGSPSQVHHLVRLTNARLQSTAISLVHSFHHHSPSPFAVRASSLLAVRRLMVGGGRRRRWDGTVSGATGRTRQTRTAGDRIATLNRAGEQPAGCHRGRMSRARTRIDAKIQKSKCRPTSKWQPPGDDRQKREDRQEEPNRFAQG